jgi:hypothetical protein
MFAFRCEQSRQQTADFVGQACAHAFFAIVRQRKIGFRRRSRIGGNGAAGGFGTVQRDSSSNRAAFAATGDSSNRSGSDRNGDVIRTDPDAQEIYRRVFEHPTNTGQTLPAVPLSSNDRLHGSSR